MKKPIQRDSKNDYLVFHQKCLRIAGVSLKEKETVWYNLYSFFVLTCILGCPISILLSLPSIDRKKDMDVFLDNLAYSAAYITASSKILSMFRVRKQVGRTLNILQSGVFTPNKERGGETEELLINECTFYVNLMGIVLLITACFNVTSSFVETLIPRIRTDDWILPYGGFSLFNVTYSPNFEVVWTYQMVFVSILCLGFVSVTTFIAGVLAYLSYQCILLQNFIKSSIAYSARQMLKQEQEKIEINADIKQDKVKWKYLKRTLKEVVEYHTAIIQLADQFEELLNISTLVDFLGQSVIICLVLFYCSTFPVLNLRLFNQVTLGGGNVFLQFITAYWGHQLIVKSEGVANACYEVPFVGVDPKMQKSLVIITGRSQRAMMFTVGKFAPLSLNTFVTVIRSAYSYYAVLHNFKE